MIAAYLLACLLGPLNRLDWRGVVTSLTGALAKELRDAMELTADVSGLTGLELRKSPPPGILFGRRKSQVRFLAADRATGHAIGADLAIIDEAGLLQENKRELWNALTSSISGRDGRFWAISIQGDGPMFSEMETMQGMPGVHFCKWTSNTDCKLDDQNAWHLSNPGLKDGIKSIGYMQHQANRAKVTPSNEMHFRAYDLNQPVNPDKEMIVSVADYVKCIKPEMEPFVNQKVIVGIDLGGTISMTCAAIYSPKSKRLEVRGAFGSDPPITERARVDRMGSKYDIMIREGQLKLYPGRVTPIIPFLQDLWDWFAKSNLTPMIIGLDRYRKAEAQQFFNEADIRPLSVQWRGQGAGKSADGSHDVRAFQRLIHTQQLHINKSTMLECAIASSAIRYDVAGNPALDKQDNRSRIDALSATIIACGIGQMLDDEPLMKLTIM